MHGHRSDFTRTTPSNQTTVLTILLVEDEHLVRFVAREALEGYGYSVLEAENGDDAMEVARRFEGQIDLLLTDLVMPEIGGGTLAKGLSASRPEMKILYMSAYAEGASSVPEIEIAFLQKPFTISDLAASVRAALAGTELPRPAREMTRGVPSARVAR